MRRPARAVFAALVLLLAAAAAARAEPVERGGPGARKGTVVLLHGLARSSGSMQPLADLLERKGYRVENVDYPSTQHSVGELVAFLRARLAECCSRDDETIHFVAHSLGGILTRAYLLEQRPPRLGRVVMLAPPNQGSEWVDRLREYAAFEAVLGPVANELGTDPDSLPNRLNRLGPVDYELGVIAGTATVNPLGGLIISGESDGTVSVESTRAPGMVDFVTVDADHTFIMQDEAAMQQTLHFLEHGRFTRRER